MRNNFAMTCFDCGSFKHLTFHRACPTDIESMKKRSVILYRVHKLLTKVYKLSEVLACLLSASDEPPTIRDDKNSYAASEPIEVGFSLNQSNDSEPESVDDLFGTAFERSLSRRMEKLLYHDSIFQKYSAN